MKQKFILMLAFLFTLISITGQVNDLPFTKGFNLGEWFENFNEVTDIKFKKYIRQDFENIKALGCDHVRLPIEFFRALGPSPDFTIDPLLFYFVDEVANWAEELEIYLIIDNHSFDDDLDTSPEVGDTLLAVWPQIAEHFKNRSEYIIYEILNEPHGISDYSWDSIQKKAVDSIRSVDKEHTIIVGPAEWYNYIHLYQMSEYSSDNLIYTFHFYDPFLFTTALEIIIPYPYDPGRMPDMPSEWIGDWYEDLYNAYPSQGNDVYLYKLIDTAIAFREEKEVPVYCGEFGVNMGNCEIADRAYWISTIRSYLEKNNIPWTMWSYTDYMGIFDPTTPQLFEYNMDTTIAKALGLSYPVQKEFQIRPDSTGFFLYDDYIPQFIVEESWASGGDAQYLSQNEPRLGKFCLSWANADRYGNLGFRFYPVKDLSKIEAEGYVLDFWVRCSTPGIQIDLRFEDTDTGTMDHPWRKSVTLDNTLAAFDGNWQHVRVPLSDFIETGAWEDNTLYPPEGKFDWTRIERFDFVAENSHLHDVEFFFDHIQIVDSSVVTSNNIQIISYPKQPELVVYSNSYDHSIQIIFTISETLPVRIALYDIAGKKVDMLAQQTFNPGCHTIRWQGNPLATGIYFIQLQSNNFSTTRKLIISHE